MSRTLLLVTLFAVLAFFGLRAFDDTSPSREVYIFGLLLVLQVGSMLPVRARSARNARLITLLVLPALISLGLAVLRATQLLQIERMHVWIVFGVSAVLVMAGVSVLEARQPSAR